MKQLACACVVLLAAGVAAQDKKPEPKGEPVSGRVTLDGKPLSAGVVTFVSKDGKTTVAAPVIDGRFLATVPVGEYAVGITPPRPPREKDPKEKPPAPAPVIPAKYGDPKTSGITYKVTDGKQDFDIDLKSK
jgi:hypothetical protein